MSADLLQKVVFGPGCIDFALAYPRLRAPWGAGLFVSFTAPFAWLVLAYVGGK